MQRSSLTPDSLPLLTWSPRNTNNSSATLENFEEELKSDLKRYRLQLAGMREAFEEAKKYGNQ